MRSQHVYIIDAVAEIGDKFQPIARLRDQGCVDPVGHGRDQHIGRFDRFDDIGPPSIGRSSMLRRVSNNSHIPRFDKRRNLRVTTTRGFFFAIPVPDRFSGSCLFSSQIEACPTVFTRP